MAYALCAGQENGIEKISFLKFLPRDAMQRAVMPQYVVRLSVCPSVTFMYRDHRLELFENNFTAE